MKEKAYYLHYQENANSWGRMMMLFQLYWPCLRQGFFTCFLYPFLVYFMAIFAMTYSDISLKWLLEFPLVILICCAPLMLTKRDYRDICAQLPVTRIEKLGFLLLTFIIVVPLTVEIGLKLSQALCKLLFATSFKINIFNLATQGTSLNGIPLYMLGTLLEVVIILVVLFYVVKSKNRELAGVVSFFVLLIILMLGGMLIGFIGAIRGELFMTDHEYIIFAVSVMMLLYIIIGTVFLVKLYKYLLNHGF